MGDIFTEADEMKIGEKSLSRNVKIYLGHRYSGETLKTIGDHFGISDSAACHASKRAEKRIEQDEKLRKRVEVIEKKIGFASFKT
jgi:chromosomal replication initiation ATPase DnaA